MAHSHSHARRDDAPKVAVAPGALIVLLLFLALCAIATAFGVVRLWPDSGEVSKLQDKAQ